MEDVVISTSNNHIICNSKPRLDSNDEYIPRFISSQKSNQNEMNLTSVSPSPCKRQAIIILDVNNIDNKSPPMIEPWDSQTIQMLDMCLIELDFIQQESMNPIKHIDDLFNDWCQGTNVNELHWLHKQK